MSAEVSERLANAIANHGKASLILWVAEPQWVSFINCQNILDWSKVTVTLADERWVDNDHKDSNEVGSENLLINEAHCAKFLSLKNSAQTAADGEAELEADFSKIRHYSGYSRYG